MRFVALLTVALGGSACAAVETTEIRVRDPAQIAVERVTRTGTVPLLLASARSMKHSYAGRDIDGFPTLGAAGGWLAQDNGTLAVLGAPLPDRTMLRVPTTMLVGGGPCRRNPSRTCARRAAIEFVTPWSNVISVRTRPGPIREDDAPFEP